MSQTISSTFSEKVKAELELNSRNLQQNLAKYGIKIGYNVCDDKGIL